MKQDSKIGYSQFRMILINSTVRDISAISKQIALCLWLVLTGLIGYSQDDYVAYGNLDYCEDRVFLPEIKTVRVHPAEAPLSPPYIELNSGIALECSFDDISGEFRDFSYTIHHCTHDWELSDLHTSEFIRGFNSLQIFGPERSFGTRQAYIHYSFVVGDDQMTPRLSGNYLLIVYEDNDPDNIVFTKRFVVFEQLVRFRTRVKEATIVSDARYRQEVDFDLLPITYPIYNPYTDLHIAILQNNRWDNTITDLQPVFVKDREITFDHDTENNFDGLNEYRFFDTSTLLSNSAEVAAVGVGEDGLPVAILLPDQKRTYDVYRSDRDINGRYLPRTTDRDDDVLESDYAWVHFALQADEPFHGGEVFVFGEFSMNRCDRENRMTWNPAKKQYELRLLLKQGYYNYLYALRQADNSIDITSLEGSHFATENQYTVFAYYSDPSTFSDRVIGAVFTDSYNR